MRAQPPGDLVENGDADGLSLPRDPVGHPEEDSLREATSADPTGQAIPSQAVQSDEPVTPRRPGQLFLLDYRYEGARDSGVNFFAEGAEDILLHIGIRHADRKIVLNDCYGGNWGKETIATLGEIDGVYLVEISSDIVELRRDGQEICARSRTADSRVSLKRAMVYGDLTLREADEESAGQADRSVDQKFNDRSDGAGSAAGALADETVSAPNVDMIAGGQAPVKLSEILGQDTVGGLDAQFRVTYRHRSAANSEFNLTVAGTNDIALHIGIRESEKRIVLNDYFRGRWGREASGALPRTDGEFVLEINDGWPRLFHGNDFVLKLRRQILVPAAELTIQANGDFDCRLITQKEAKFLQVLREESFGGCLFLLDFDPDNYLNLNSDIIGNDYSASELLAHFLTFGVSEGRQYSSTEIFDPDFYVQYYDDIDAETVSEAYRHWLLTGHDEGRVASEPMYLASLGLPFFPKSFSYRNYVASRVDLPALLPTKWHALEHWLNKGSKELSNLSLLDIFDEPREAALLLEAIGNRNARWDDIAAVRLYEKSLACDDSIGECWQHLGDSLLRLRLFGLAAGAYRRVEDFKAQNEYTYLNLYTCQRELGRPDLALVAARTLRTLYPGIEAGHVALDEIRELIFKRLRDASIVRCLIDGNAEASSLMTSYADSMSGSGAGAARLPARRLEPGEQPRIIIFGTPYLNQCLQYRINQKIEHLVAACYDVLFISQDSPEEFIRKATFYDIAIFYRIPATPRIQKTIEYARARGMTTIYEIDDFIFDSAFFPEPIESYGGQIADRDYANLVVDTPLFRLAMSLCDYGLASTPTLQAEVARVVRTGKCFLHRNGFDARHERFAAIFDPAIRPSRAPDEPVRIFYGTATRAHNEDFDLLAAPAIAAVMARHPDVRFVVAGYLSLPPLLKPFAERISQLPPVWDLDAYWSVLSGIDINIAVLKDGIVSDCKSEIKWLEAAMVGVPSVVSRTATYAEILIDNDTVMFATTPEEWAERLDRLVTDPDLRRSIGSAAYRHAVSEYGIPRMSANLDSILAEAHPARSRAAKPIITLVNVFFPPQLIGGATRVLKDNLDYFLEHHADEYDFQVFCAIEGGAEPYAIRNFSYRGIPVFGVVHPQREKLDLSPYDDKMGEIFAEYLKWQQPSLIHFHCIQRLTASIVGAARDHGIPYFVTVHDAWWISDYQFLVDEKGRLRDRDNARPLEQALSEDVKAIASLARSAKLRSELARARAVFAVSAPFERIYRDHGVGNIRTVSNGVSDLPRCDKRPSTHGRVRLGLLGGTEAHKGLPLVKMALMSTNFDNLHLTVVDHALPAFQTMPEQIWGTTPVVYTGKVPQERVVEIYAGIDVLLAPSIWPESYGLVTREALKCGLWVLASDRGAVGGDVTPGQNGFVVDVSDVRGLIDALQQIDEDPERYKRSPDFEPTLRTAADQARDLIGLYRSAIDDRAAQGISRPKAARR